MVAEYFVVESTQGAPAHQAEVGHVLLVETGESHPVFLAPAGHQADFAHEFLFRCAVPESRVAGAKNGSQYAIAWGLASLEVRLPTFAFTGNAELLSQPDRL